ncbi:VCBS domain-containing protein [Vibrio sp. Makdt]|uniref:VCBS domain-containing protein n=1 Tax=Vibrio sp. Makdt TaxID=2998828 RepID=UPI0022CD9E55|nr:VCBS domain-containing protein [Vibrio sp. Makdt]MDA0153665.1 VCBS domain-containing protein [Vibrio sp. Makdt]
MGSVNLNILGLASGSIVLDAQGRLRQLAPGEQPASSDVVISFAENEENVPSVSARFVDSQGQQSELEIDDAIAQVERAIEDGFDPTELGGEFDTAAGDQGSSLTNSGRIERTGTESQAETDFETSGFESQGLSVTQSLTLFNIIALALVSGETNAVELEQDQPIEAGGSLTLDKQGVIFIEQEVVGENGLGTFTVNADGTWTFLANDSFNELGIGQQAQDSTIVRTSDGVEQRITVTIVGTDDRAIATNGSGSVTEDIGTNEETSKLQTSGEVTITDVDSTTPTFLPNSAFDVGKSTNTTQLGELSITPSGSWIYNINNDDVQYLGEGESVTETYVVTASDGTTSEITIVINGADDSSEISVEEGDSDTGSVIEDVDADEESNHLEVTGTLTIIDNDLNDAPRFNPTGVFTSLGSTGISALGTLAITESGLWTYTVNNDLVQHLNTGEVITERYGVTSTDGAEHIIEITINGTNDAPVATGFSVDGSGEPHQSDGDGEGVVQYGDIETAITFNSTTAAQDRISDIEDDHNEVDLHIVIKSLPTSGTLLYTNTDGITREVVESDLSGETQFDHSGLSYVAGAGEAFLLGITDAPNDDTLVSEDGFYNWGSAVEGSGGMRREVELANGSSIYVEIDNPNNKPLKQYNAEQSHVGYGIGDSDGRGINRDETLTIDFAQNPISEVRFGLDGLGPVFEEDNPNVVRAVFYFVGGGSETVEYEKEPGETGVERLFYEFTYSSPGQFIEQVEFSNPKGSWELRYIGGDLEVSQDSFDYQVVDSTGELSSVETVTLNVEGATAYQVLSDPESSDFVAGLGNEILIGNDADNIFEWVDSALDSSVDVVKEFTVGEDLLEFSDILDATGSDSVDDLIPEIDAELQGDNLVMSIEHDGGQQTIVLEDVKDQLIDHVVDSSFDSISALGELIKNDAA